jgi:hypothetical protein
VQPDHTFSEMSFLSRGNHLSLHPMSSVRDEPASLRGREFHQELQLDHLLRDPLLALSRSSNNSLGVKRKLDTPHTPSFTVEEPIAREVYTDAHNSGNASPEPGTKRRKTSSLSVSIPYTWSESGVNNLDESSGLEQYLLNIMHVGLDPQTLSSEISKSVLARRYWSLSELWVLLWKRKAFWPNKTENKKQDSTEPNIEQKAEAEVAPENPQENITPDNSVEVSQTHTEVPNAAPKTVIETACTANSDRLEQHSVLEQQDTLAQEKDEVLQMSDRKSCLNAATNVVEATNNQNCSTDTLKEDNCEFPSLEGPGDNSASPAPTLEVQQGHVPSIDIYEISRVIDDDEFYHTLDAAYDAIMSPGLAAEVASNIQQLIAFHELDGTFGVTSRPQPIQNADYVDLTQDIEEGEPEGLATVSENTIQDNHDARLPEPSQQHELPMQHSNEPLFHQSNGLSGQLPWLATEYVQPTLRTSPEIIARQSQLPGICEFWRQNRLY